MDPSRLDIIDRNDGGGRALRRFIIHTVFKYAARRPANRWK